MTPDLGQNECAGLEEYAVVLGKQFGELLINHNKKVVLQEVSRALEKYAQN